jgi:hypothetical protein
MKETTLSKLHYTYTYSIFYLIKIYELNMGRGSTVAERLTGEGSMIPESLLGVQSTKKIEGH